jgi:hypothetical protein
MIATKLDEVCKLRKRLNEYACIGLKRTLWGECTQVAIAIKLFEIEILKELKP